MSVGKFLNGFLGNHPVYGDVDKLPEMLLYKRIVEWNEDKLVLDDGTIVTIECSEHDCCAWAGGEFSNVTLDAVITDVEIGDVTQTYGMDEYDDGNQYDVTIKLYHNQNPIAQADISADDGNGGYYYSVGSFVVNGVHFPVVEA